LELAKQLVFFTGYLSQNAFPQPLSEVEEAEWLVRLQEGDAEARDILIRHNLRLVAHIAKKFESAPEEQDDLISIGTIGLIKGINSFKPEKGTKLATYVSRCIENEILMYFRNIKKTSQEISFNEPIDVDNEGNPLTLIDIIAVDDTIIDDIDYKNKLRKSIEIINNIESKRDRKIIIMRYGLDGNVPKTQREVAKELNISRSYVSRIEKRIIETIRNEFN
jgi:RNA polymerase sporulation-specific sigma factor